MSCSSTPYAVYATPALLDTNLTSEVTACDNHSSTDSDNKSTVTNRIIETSQFYNWGTCRLQFYEWFEVHKFNVGNSGGYTCLLKLRCGAYFVTRRTVCILSLSSHWKLLWQTKPDCLTFLEDVDSHSKWHTDWELFLNSMVGLNYKLCSEFSSIYI